MKIIEEQRQHFGFLYQTTICQTVNCLTNVIHVDVYYDNMLNCLSVPNKSFWPNSPSD